MQEQPTVGEIMDRFYIQKYLERITEADNACQRILAVDKARGITGDVNDAIFRRHCIYNKGKAAAEALLNGRTLYTDDNGQDRLLTEAELREDVGNAYAQAIQLMK